MTGKPGRQAGSRHGLDEPNQVLYSETQRFSQWWIWVLVLGIAGLMWFGAVQQLLFGIPFGGNPAPDPLMWVLLLTFGIAMPLFMYALNLRTEVRPDGLYLKMFLLHLRYQVIPWQEIERFYPRTYRSIREYGGWGIRYGPSGKAYNIKGNQGIQLELNGGRRLLVGSGDPESLVGAITAASGVSPLDPDGSGR